MIFLPKTERAWDTAGFEEAFKAELSTLGSELPLQQGLTSGSYAVEDSVEVMILSKSADHEFIRIKTDLAYKSLMPGCACAGDPTVEDAQNEHMTVLISINRKTGETLFRCLEN